MSDIRIKIGDEFFREVRENSCCYADKTPLIEEFLSGDPPRVSLFIRPRRFGKTLMMTMLSDFFDISQDSKAVSKAIFEGLAISKNRELCEQWMNQYPVIFITLNHIDAQNFSHAVEQVRTLVRWAASDYYCLLESDKVDERDKIILQGFLDSKSSHSELEAFLLTLCRALHAHYGKPAILLIDEYDDPLIRAQGKGYYSEIEEFLRTMLNKAVQGNPSLQFAILTGCLRVAKESLFTGIDDVQFFDISEARFADKIGFTPKEVDDLLAGCPEEKDAIREWYDGYRFGAGTKIICPCDIWQYLRTSKSNPDAMPEVLWEYSRGRKAFCLLIERADSNAVEKLEKLLSGGYAAVSISKTLIPDTMFASEAGLWTLLYQSGYLTQADSRKVHSSDAGPDAGPDAGKTPLVIPNKAIRILFIEAIRAMTDDSLKSMDRKPFLDAFWNGDSKAFQDILSGILQKAIYYDNYYDNFYHAVLKGLFAGAGRYVKVKNARSLGGRSILIKDTHHARAAIIEARYAGTSEEMARDAEDALSKIEANRYIEKFEGAYKEVMLWGISFYEKSCACRAGEILKPQYY